jgi:hypothetical protein
MESQLGVNDQEVAEPVDAPVQPTQEEQQAQNWREVNKLLHEQKAAIERLAREKEEMAALMQQAFQKPPQQEEEDEEIDVYSPDFGRKLERKLEKAVEKTYEKIEQKRKNDPAYLEEQARKRYTDFDQVMTPEHIDTIIKSNALVHKSVMASGSPLEAAYEFIKASAAYQGKQSSKNVTQRLVSEEKARFDENQAKPKSSHSVGRSQAISAVSGFGRLTKEQAAEIHAETMRIKRGR